MAASSAVLIEQLVQDIALSGRRGKHLHFQLVASFYPTEPFEILGD
jgi:hypothetical protein